MKTLLGVLAMTLALATPAFAADPLEGIWKTKPDDNGNYGHVKIEPCGPAFCGVLIESYASDGKKMASANIGKQIVWDMSAKGDGTYGGGKVWAPDRNKTYNGKMTLAGDNLDVAGCVLGICRASSWTKVK